MSVPPDHAAFLADIASLGRALDEKSRAGRIQASGPSPMSTYPLSDPDAWWKLFGSPTDDVVTAETAKAQHAVFICVRLIAGAVASMPLGVFRKGLEGKDQELDTPESALLARSPCPRYSRTVFWRQIVADMLLNGNGVAWIERRGPRAKALWVIPWNRVGIQFYRAPDGSSRLLYHLTKDEGVHVQVDQDDVLHFPGSPFWNIFFSVSPITAYARSVGIAIGAERLAQAYFRNGFSAQGAIKLPGRFANPEQADEYRRRVIGKLGGEDRFAGPMILDGGADWLDMRMNAADSQLLESRQWSALEIASIFGVPGHFMNVFEKIAAVGKGLEELNQYFIDHALGPHLNAIEEEVNRKLLGDDPARAALFDRDSLLRGDLKARYEADQMAIGGAQGPGWKTINEVRERNGFKRLGDAKFDTPLEWGAQAPQAPPDGAAKPDKAQPAGPNGPSRKK